MASFFIDNHLGFDDDGKGWMKVAHDRRQRVKRVKSVGEEITQRPERDAGEHQDWSRVVLKRTKAVTKRDIHHDAAQQLKDTRSTPDAMAPGQMRRLEQSNLPPKRKELSSESRRKIQQMRFGMGFTQDQLNAMCSFPVNTIREIEAGHLCPNPKQLARLSHELKTSLKYDWV